MTLIWLMQCCPCGERELVEFVDQAQVPHGHRDVGFLGAEKQVARVQLRGLFDIVTDEVFDSPFVRRGLQNRWSRRLGSWHFPGVARL